jgi:hypothetical protein
MGLEREAMTFALRGYVFSMGAACVLLAGCGGSQPPIGASGAMRQSADGDAERGVSTLRPGARSSGYKVTAPLLYVNNSTAAYDDVRVYIASANDPTPLATISDGVNTPIGACIDGEGTLYVMNEPSSSSGWISEYRLGKTTPSRIITDGVDTPAFCAIDAKGNLWVSNVDGVPNVTEYRSGAKRPHTVITKDLVFPVGVAIDHSGNLYVANGWDAPQQNIEVYLPGSKSPSRTITEGVTSPFGIAVDSDGTLYVANEFQNNVEEYRSGQGSPFQTITKGASGPTGLTVNKEGSLYVADLGTKSRKHYNTVTEFAPRSIKPLSRKISKGLWDPVGVAYYPALLP